MQRQGRGFTEAVLLSLPASCWLNQGLSASLLFWYRVWWARNKYMVNGSFQIGTPVQKLRAQVLVPFRGTQQSGSAATVEERIYFIPRTAVRFPHPEGTSLCSASLKLPPQPLNHFPTWDYCPCWTRMPGGFHSFPEEQRLGLCETAARVQPICYFTGLGC